MADYLDIAAVARLAGVSPSTIRSYRALDGREERAHLPRLMPEPDITLGQSPGWLPATIDAWLAARPGRGTGPKPRKVAAKAKPATKRKP